MNKSIFFDKIYRNLINKYGEHSADKIVQNVDDIYRYSREQISSKKLNKNILLIGKVQSGKTSNLELLTALNFDNGFNLLVIYGGYDKNLLKQTVDRFRNDFGSPSPDSPNFNYSKEFPAIFSTDDEAVTTLESDIIKKMIRFGQPIIIISMKRPVAMNKVNKVLSVVDKTNIKSFVIDDEGDQASLNIAKDKTSQERASATYKRIVELKHILNDPLYYSVTATPEANVFQSKWSEILPNGLKLIYPGEGYNGCNTYYLDNINSDSHTVFVSEEDAASVLEGGCPASLRNAFYYFLLASAFKKKKYINDSKIKNQYSDMIVHSVREKDNHRLIYSVFSEKLKSYKLALKSENIFSNGTILNLKNTLKTIYDEFISTLGAYEFDELFSLIIDPIDGIITNSHIVLQNSDGKLTQGNLNFKAHKIYIGGDLLQRGLTFDNLITTYFTRWPSGEATMDASMQRARWFGYREKYLSITKIFTTKDIYEKFINLAVIEQDLWDQFEDIQNGAKSIRDIIISAEDPKLRPASKAKIDVINVKYNEEWKRQHYILRNKNEITNIKLTILNLIDSFKTEPITCGSTNNLTTGHIICANKNSLNDLIQNLKPIFNIDKKLGYEAVLNEISHLSNGNIIIMGEDTKGTLRERSVFTGTNEIKPLFQGSDVSDLSKAKYLGDRFVLQNKDIFTIQIHRVQPLDDYCEAFEQYMIAIHIPTQKNYYLWNKNK